MMTPTEQELAHKARSNPKWRWMSGMANQDGDRVVDEKDDKCRAQMWINAHVVHIVEGKDDEEIGIPDLSDPATQGCLIAMLGDNLIKVGLTRDGSGDPPLWFVGVRVAIGHYYQSYKNPTLGEALTRACMAVHGGGE